MKRKRVVLGEGYPEVLTSWIDDQMLLGLLDEQNFPVKLSVSKLGRYQKVRIIAEVIDEA